MFRKVVAIVWLSVIVQIWLAVVETKVSSSTRAFEHFSRTVALLPQKLYFLRGFRPDLKFPEYLRSLFETITKTNTICEGELHSDHFETRFGAPICT